MSANGQNPTQKEKDIIESALCGDSGKLPGPLDANDEAFAKDILEIKAGLAALEDDEPPRDVFPLAPSKSSHHFGSWMESLPIDWYANPFVLVFGFFIAMVFLYVVMIFVFKG